MICVISHNKLLMIFRNELQSLSKVNETQSNNYIFVSHYVLNKNNYRIMIFCIIGRNREARDTATAGNVNKA